MTVGELRWRFDRECASHSDYANFKGVLRSHRAGHGHPLRMTGIL